MANTVLKHTGKNVGKSICEHGIETLVREIFDNSKKYDCKIIIPQDVIVSKGLDGKGEQKEVENVENDDNNYNNGNYYGFNSSTINFNKESDFIPPFASRLFITLSSANFN